MKKKFLHASKTVQHFIENARKKKQKIAAYGASTTVITLMYHFELENKLDYLLDDNAKKQGLFSPGRHLEVKPGSALYTEKPDIVIILAWQYAEAIIRKHQQFIAEGGVFVIPLPTLKIISSITETVV